MIRKAFFGAHDQIECNQYYDSKCLIISSLGWKWGTPDLQFPNLHSQFQVANVVSLDAYLGRGAQSWPCAGWWSQVRLTCGYNWTTVPMWISNRHSIRCAAAPLTSASTGACFPPVPKFPNSCLVSYGSLPLPDSKSPVSAHTPQIFYLHMLCFWKWSFKTSL